MSIEYAVLAGGCFWCTEAVFKQIDGVLSVESGYTGGHTENPTYREVCSGDTGHAEAIRLGFDTDKVAYSDLLDIFFAIHDPTQLNRQGNDTGTQYRSAIFPQSEVQKQAAEDALRRAQADYDDKIVTAIEPASIWNAAEEYHQNYWQGEGQQNGYCLAVIPPKLQKLKKQFASRLTKA